MIALLVPRQRNTVRRSFNYLGFCTLAITVASVQFVLDRGERMDWFSSPTIIILTLAAAGALWVFIVNSATSRTPFVDPAIFRNRFYVLGIVLRILFGVFLFSSLVLVPPFLQNQGGYPIIDSGVIMASRGAGAMFAATFTGYMLKYIDPRKVILFGMALSAYSMWEFSNFTQDIDLDLALANNFAQGMALSFFIIPVNTVAFTSLPSEQRDAGTSFYSLLNNIGRTLGIALFASYLARNTQANHEILSAQITPFNNALRHVGMPEVWNLDTLAGLQAVNRMVTGQAELIAYITDFHLLAAIIVVCMPVVFLLQNPLHQAKT
jgi:DHA2 family multidrug resistance protein